MARTAAGLSKTPSSRTRELSRCPRGPRDALEPPAAVEAHHADRRPAGREEAARQDVVRAHEARVRAPPLDLGATSLIGPAWARFAAATRSGSRKNAWHARPPAAAHHQWAVVAHGARRVDPRQRDGGISGSRMASPASVTRAGNSTSSGESWSMHGRRSTSGRRRRRARARIARALNVSSSSSDSATVSLQTGASSSSRLRPCSTTTAVRRVRGPARAAPAAARNFEPARRGGGRRGARCRPPSPPSGSAA